MPSLNDDDDDDADTGHAETEDNEGHNDEDEGREGASAHNNHEVVMDEATSGFLDKVNSGSINSAQFMPAIFDLPEKVAVKKRKRPQPRAKPKSPPAATAKKKRKRDTMDSSDESYDDDAEYRPTTAKTKRRDKSAKSATGASRATRASTAPKRKYTQRREFLFGCRFCDFKTETIGMPKEFSVKHLGPVISIIIVFS